MENPNSKLLHSDLTEKTLGVYYDVYNEIGHGFLESVYANCMAMALTSSGIPVQREVPIPVFFRGQDVGQFKADLVVNKCVLVELKAVQNLDRAHEAQVMNYLRATELEVALLLNFGCSKPQFRRIVFENSNKRIRVHPRVSAVGNS
ncbi:MAG TPA: GxxExxY protein [Candidatus Angelobacter sp.]|nr:GxxExxY protein [Candidatus Angelobacter sp.]